MKQIISTFFLSVLTITMSAQEYAEFSTDTTRFQIWNTKDNGKLPESITEQVWFINGQEMRYGSEVIRVEVNPHKLDTILYRGYRRNEFDTIICNVSEPKKYKFFYNECCGAFNIQDEANQRFIQAKVIYQMMNPDDHIYLGTLGEAGKLVTPNDTGILSEFCRSAMSPNVYHISFSQIEPCGDSPNCPEGICLMENGEVNWEFGYETISKKTNFLFMPLKSEPLLIIYDAETGLIELK